MHAKAISVARPMLTVALDPFAVVAIVIVNDTATLSAELRHWSPNTGDPTLPALAPFATTTQDQYAEPKAVRGDVLQPKNRTVRHRF
jgi:hypothetical protein